MRHMLAAADAIERYVARGRGAFDTDSAVREAIVYQIVILGEAAKAVVAADSSVERDFPNIKWSPLARMRDKVTHQYWAVDGEIVWSVAKQDVPVIRALLTEALASPG
jgi:uncharacterized protein with HEPN domain